MPKEIGLVVKKNKAEKGDVILFERKERLYQGTVYHVRDQSVVVEISTDAAEFLGYPRENTIVGHGNYLVCSN